MFLCFVMCGLCYVVLDGVWWWDVLCQDCVGGGSSVQCQEGEDGKMVMVGYGVYWFDFSGWW